MTERLTTRTLDFIMSKTQTERLQLPHKASARNVALAYKLYYQSPVNSLPAPLSKALTTKISVNFSVTLTH